MTPASAAPRALAVLRRVRARWRAVVGMSLLFGVLEAAVIVPIAAWVLRAWLLRYGRASVGNFEIATFLLSGPGALAAVTVLAVVVAGAYLHVAGLLRVLADPPSTVRAAVAGLVRAGPRLARLGLLQVGVGVVVAAPFAVATLFALQAVWGEADLNGMLALRPPAFWVGVGVAGALSLALAVILLRLALRWLFALPILLEDPAASPRAALAASAARTRGLAGRHLAALAGWALATFAATTALQAGVAALGERLLDAVGPRLVVALPATAAVLAAATAAAVLSGWASIACLAGLVDHLHHEATGRTPPPPSPAPPPARSAARRGLLALGAVAAATAVAAAALLARSRPRDVVEVTAHRMGAVAAPENTLAALARAIADGADWAELDVQLTADGHLVVLHDFDLVRVGGPRRRVAASTLAEVRAIDVGRGLRHAGFEGERVPTLDDVIAAAGDRIRLNIELKPPDAAAAAPLTDAVVAAVRRAGLVGRCRLCSQSYDALRRAKAAEPGLEVGFIAGAAVGDLAALDVDFLMVHAGLVTPAFVRRAHGAGLEVHPWTVNDPDAVPRLVDAGVDNVITDAPREVRARVDEVLGLSLAERLLLRVRGRLTDGR